MFYRLFKHGSVYLTVRYLKKCAFAYFGISSDILKTIFNYFFQRMHDLTVYYITSFYRNNPFRLGIRVLKERMEFQIRKIAKVEKFSQLD